MRGEIFLVGVLSLLVFSSGCLCCSTDGLKGVLGPKGGDATGIQNDNDISRCNPPYIYYGSGCCLDENQNDICDSDERTSSTLETQYVEVTETTLDESAAETTLAPTTTIVETASTTTLHATMTTVKNTYSCVQAAGYDPDKVIYVYSNRCGNDFTSTVMHASSNTGVGFQMINIGTLESGEIDALECFYGGYYQGNLEFSYCPRLLCPRTGQMENVDGKRPVLSQMMGFARKCA